MESRFTLGRSATFVVGAALLLRFALSLFVVLLLLRLDDGSSISVCLLPATTRASKALSAAGAALPATAPDELATAAVAHPQGPPTALRGPDALLLSWIVKRSAGSHRPRVSELSGFWTACSAHQGRSTSRTKVSQDTCN